MAVAALTAALLPSAAQGQQPGTTYDVTIGADFFAGRDGVPGFSARIYPGSVSLHKGDTVHFGGPFGAVPAFYPEGMEPAEASERYAAVPGDRFFFVVPDPDEGSTAFKIDDSAFAPTTTGCGTVDNPCDWDGSDPDDILLSDVPGDLHVTVTANAGDVIYAGGINFGGHDTFFRIEVVPNNETADTQGELDVRAAQLMQDDLDKARALHAKYSAKRTSHIRADGTRVFDVWAGIENGPVALLGFYPRKITIKKGQTVQWHFDYENMEAHNVIFPFDKARNILRNSFVPGCDPDGDDGTAPDTEPTFPPDGPPECPPGSVLELDLHPDEVLEAGNNVFTGNADFENSGVRSGQMLQDGFFSESPWNLKFKATTKGQSWRYMCTIHGPGLMGGRIKVRS